MFVQEINEVFSMSQRPRLSSVKMSGDLSLAAKKKLQSKLQKNFPWVVAKSRHPLSQGWHLPPHGYRPALRSEVKNYNFFFEGAYSKYTILFISCQTHRNNILGMQLPYFAKWCSTSIFECMTSMHLTRTDRLLDRK